MNEETFRNVCNDILKPFVVELATDKLARTKEYIRLEVRRQLNEAFNAAESTTTER